MSDNKILKSILRDAVNKKFSQNNDELVNKAKQAIVEGNPYKYRRVRTELVLVALKELESVLKKENILCSNEHNKSTPSLVLLSFHTSSEYLRGWDRIVYPEAAWSKTRYNGGEIKYFKDIYTWDPRQGHLLSDPGMPDNLDVTFGTNNTTDGSENINYKLSSSDWKKAYLLVISPFFPDLVNHELDICDNENQIKSILNAKQYGYNKIVINDFAKIVIAFANSLRQSWPKEFWSSQLSNAAKVRSFLLSFFYTIGRYEKTSFERIIATSISSFNEKIGTLAVVVAGETNKITQINISAKTILPAAEAIAYKIFEIEHRTLVEWIDDENVSIKEEDTIRQSCEVDYQFDKNMISRDLLCRLSEPIHNEIIKSINLIHQNSSDPSLSDCLKKDVTIKKIISDCGIVGSSRAYIKVIRDLAAAARMDDFNETRVIFLESEPGCGKEMLAKLIHLFSPRAHLDVLKTENINVLKSRMKIVQNSTLSNFNCPDSKNDDKVEKVMRKWLNNRMCDTYQEHRLFNYFTLNMATLTNERNFLKALFDKNVGRCFLAHAVGGTVFLDEFNTLPIKEHANVFLRLLEKPYEMEIPYQTGGPLQDVNMLTIIASNKSRDELIEAGFNEAVVYRVTKNQFRIPPLRERPADIAVFVNNVVRKYNERYKKNNILIRRIDMKAMRLICELRWSNNYRGIQGLMDDVLGDRIQRGIEYQELTFEDVLRGLRRKEAFQADVSHGKTEAIQRAAIK